jgi:hypothetical protein
MKSSNGSQTRAQAIADFRYFLKYRHPTRCRLFGKTGRRCGLDLVLTGLCPRLGHGTALKGFWLPRKRSPQKSLRLRFIDPAPPTTTGGPRRVCDHIPAKRFFPRCFTPAESLRRSLTL